MFIKENNEKFNYLFHYTKKDNLSKILKEREIKTFDDKYTFFAKSYDDSCKLFKKLMMNEISYIDNKLTLQKRKMQNPNDYAILKIKVKDDNNFYRFMYGKTGFNPYNYSILHKGNLKFDKCEILEINNNSVIFEGRNINTKCYYKIKKLAITAGISILLLLGNLNTVNATSWEESNNYTTSWYNSADTSFNINNANDLAGLVHLVNSENVTFAGKVININADIDATQYTWDEISSNFRGVIEGIHKIYIALDNNDSFISDINTSTITVIKNYEIDTNISPNATIEPSGKLLVEENKDKNIKITANTGYGITEISIDGVKQTIDNDLEFVYNFRNVTKPHKITVKTGKKYTHIKNMQNNILNTLDKIQVNNYSQENPFDSSYTEIINDITYLYAYKNCMVENDIYTWNYDVSIVKQGYTVIEGDNQIYNNKDLTIRFSGKSSKFIKLYINDNEVKKENYIVEQESTIITLKNEFLKKLKEGEYNIKAEYKDGNAETKFKIINLEAEKDKTPKTGVDTNMLSVILESSLSILSIIVLLLFINNDGSDTMSIKREENINKIRIVCSGEFSVNGAFEKLNL